MPFDTPQLSPLPPAPTLPSTRVGSAPTALLQNKTQHKVEKSSCVSLQMHEVLISLSKNSLYLCYFLTSHSYFCPHQLGFQIHHSKEKAPVTFPNQTVTFLFWAVFQSGETLGDFRPGFSLPVSSTATQRLDLDLLLKSRPSLPILCLQSYLYDKHIPICISRLTTLQNPRLSQYFLLTSSPGNLNFRWL